MFSLCNCSGTLFFFFFGTIYSGCGVEPQPDPSSDTSSMLEFIWTGIS